MDNDAEDKMTLLRRHRRADKVNEASIMRSRSATKTFIRVVVPKVHVLLSARVSRSLLEICNSADSSTDRRLFLQRGGYLDARAEVAQRNDERK